MFCVGHYWELMGGGGGGKGDFWLQGKDIFKTHVLASFPGRCSSCPLELHGLGRGETLGTRLVLKEN